MLHAIQSTISTVLYYYTGCTRPFYLLCFKFDFISISYALDFVPGPGLFILSEKFSFAKFLFIFGKSFNCLICFTSDSNNRVIHTLLLQIFSCSGISDRLKFYYGFYTLRFLLLFSFHCYFLYMV